MSLFIRSSYLALVRLEFDRHSSSGFKACIHFYNDLMKEFKQRMQVIVVTIKIDRLSF